MSKDSKTHCIKGHEFTAENTIQGKRQKVCRTCLEAGAYKRTKPEAQREAEFWARVDKSKGLGPAGECWHWLGRLDRKGYGGVTYSGMKTGAHRIAHLLHYGTLPADMFVMHSCDNPRCVNPAHLSLGTNLDNVRDMHMKGRQAHQNGVPALAGHCLAGHELTPENTYVYGNRTQCKACTLARGRQRKYKKPPKPSALDAASAMIERLPFFCFMQWCKYNGKTYAAQPNLEATIRAKRPMIDLSYCITEALNGNVLMTVQYAEKAFAACPPGEEN